MNRGEGGREHFFRLEEVGEIRRGIGSAGVAGALFGNRAEVGRVAFIHDVNRAAPGIERAVPADARRCDAVKQIAAVFYRIEEVERIADAQKMARLFIRQMGDGPFQDIYHLFFSKGTAYAKAVKGQGAHELGAFYAQVFEGSTLGYSEQHLIGPGFFS